jgi:hypothetical protein
MFNKVTWRYYCYFPKFLHLIYLEKWFLQPSPILPIFVQKQQGILGINSQVMAKVKMQVLFTLQLLQ